MSDRRWTPEYLILHDYAVPKGVQLSDTAYNPYNALVYPNGQVRYRNPAAPYSERAPHAYKLNPRSIGLSYAGQYGGTPTRAGIEALRGQVSKIRQMYPGIKLMTHGEAYEKYKGTPLQASKSGRDLREASWAKYLDTDQNTQVAQNTQAPAPQRAMPPPSYSLGAKNVQPGGQPRISAPQPQRVVQQNGQRSVVPTPQPAQYRAPEQQYGGGVDWVMDSDRGMKPIFASDSAQRIKKPTRYG